MTDPMLPPITDEEATELSYARYAWGRAYDIDRGLVDGVPAFVARYKAGHHTAEQDPTPVIAPTVGELISRIRDDYGLRPEPRGGGE